MNTSRVGSAPYLLNTPGGELQGQPLAFSHRGFAPDGEENTLKAFHAAYDLGFRYLETDVHTSRDGVLVVFHDEALERLTGATGNIADLSAAEIRELRVAGEPVPTFEELLMEFPLAHFNVDVKDEPSAQQLAAVIERNGAHDRVLVASFLGRRRISAQRLLSRPVATSPGVLGVAAATMLGKLVRLPHRGLGTFAALQVPEFHGKFPVVTKSFVRHAHEAGIQVHVWVVNDAPGMHRLLDLGVDGIMSDRADILAEVMRERGHWPQNDPGV
ncbi:glycerophosphodiester phosphodiesterase [Paeniglutamicibacter sp. NPDC012692]|uniref:glycerophosphodiester phosphodiesterase n=1 Tax=Paeniglutamicibacter sp. NPDC012692 TaxID=3364388 RepID=UPI0036AED80F